MKNGLFIIGLVLLSQNLLAQVVASSLDTTYIYYKTGDGQVHQGSHESYGKSDYSFEEYEVDVYKEYTLGKLKTTAKTPYDYRYDTLTTSLIKGQYRDGERTGEWEFKAWNMERWLGIGAYKKVTYYEDSIVRNSPEVQAKYSKDSNRVRGYVNMFSYGETKHLSFNCANKEECIFYYKGVEVVRCDYDNLESNINFYAQVYFIGTDLACRSNALLGTWVADSTSGHPFKMQLKGSGDAVFEAEGQKVTVKFEFERDCSLRIGDEIYKVYGWKQDEILLEALPRKYGGHVDGRVIKLYRKN